MVELEKIDLIGRLKVIPSSDTPGLTVLDEETAAEVLKTAETIGHHRGVNQSTPPGEAEYFEGGGLMRTF